MTDAESPHGEDTRAQDLDLILHELKTPLCSILLNATALLSRTHSPERRGSQRALLRIMRSARAMQCFVGNMLDASAMEAGHLVLHCREVELDAVVDELLDVIAPIAAERQVALLRELEPGARAVFADPTRLLQVLLNLVSNALKFSRREGVVVISSERRGEEVRLSVRDEGPGIDPRVIERLFQPYGVGHGASSGHGLGLYISQRITQALGGALTVEVAAGRGTTFHVALPAREPRGFAAL